MANIGVLKGKDDEKMEKYIKKLSDNKHKIILLDDFDGMKHATEKLQGIIAFENELSDLNKICELILNMKENSDCYIWIISTATKEIGKMVYLQLGADMVFANETKVEEIQLVIHNMLSRVAQVIEPVVEQETAALQMIHSNFSALLEGGKEVPLTRLEFQILDLLHKKPKVAVTYQELYRELYKEDVGDKHYRVANIIFHLRKKIEEDAEKPKYIITIRSKGYMLNV
ncbi:winged helix-turn-helix domain-containing protein [Enterococcus crotali]|uniref:winged helix-turn-helix domain-containing protein n=1 Tax=Enterococcus crotali TaxID=1453587 RepID=UPI0004724069|nr:winged helix-turn-helix domain-containing protein [Enterococcus crotali]